jgi:hypothetical protein
MQRCRACGIIKDNTGNASITPAEMLALLAPAKLCAQPMLYIVIMITLLLTPNNAVMVMLYDAILAAVVIVFFVVVASRCTRSGG